MRPLADKIDSNSFTSCLILSRWPAVSEFFCISQSSTIIILARVPVSIPNIPTAFTLGAFEALAGPTSKLSLLER